MNQTPPLVLSIARPATQVEPEDADNMLIIVRRSYEHLLKELGEAFSEMVMGLNRSVGQVAANAISLLVGDQVGVVDLL